MLSIFDQGRAPACPEPFNLAAYVLQQAEDRADYPALLIPSLEGLTSWSYAEVERAVRGLATGLLDSGFKPGDILLMRLGNTVDFPLVFLAAIAVGIVPVPTSSQLTRPEVERIIAELNPAGIVRDPSVASGNHPREVLQQDLEALQACPPADYRLYAPDQMAYIVYTSGTGGTPRAVAHAHRAIWARRMMIRDWYDLGPEDRLLHAGAFNWTFTLGTGLMDPLSVGATAIIPAPDVPLEHLPRVLAETKATIFAAVPGVYRKILKAEHLPDLPHLRHGLCAGEKLSVEVQYGWQARTNTQLYEAFGMSECSTFISSAPHRPSEAGALGMPQEGRRIAILAEDGPAPLDQPGIIAVHRSDPGLMLGYLHAPEATQSRFQGDWFLTGDRGVMHENGQITYLGRNDDMMNAGGFRVSPMEVEKAFASLDGIKEFTASEVEVKPGVSIIVGFFTGREDVTEADLQAFADRELAEYKRPKAYLRLAEFPTNPNGKLLRRALPQLFQPTELKD